MKYRKLWPIDEKACASPAGWCGWPDGKKFALVITHDVDTETGHNRCLDLMKLDENLGFCSSFNFASAACRRERTVPIGTASTAAISS